MPVTISPERTVLPVYPGFVPEVVYFGKAATPSPFVTVRISASVVTPRCVGGEDCGCPCCSGGVSGLPAITFRRYCDCWKRAAKVLGRAHGCGCVVSEETRAMTEGEWRQYSTLSAGVGISSGGRIVTIDEDGNVLVEIDKEPANG